MKYYEREKKKLKSKAKNDSLTNLRSESIKVDDFNCEICIEKFSSNVKLKVHVKLVHHMNSFSQTEAKEVETIGIKTIDDNDELVSLNTVISNIKEFEKYSC